MMKKKIFAAIIALSVAASVAIGNVSAAELTETRASSSYSSVIEYHVDWIRSYLSHIINWISGGTSLTSIPDDNVPL